MENHNKKNIYYFIITMSEVLVLLGVVAICIGFISSHRPLSCGSQRMKPNDYCLDTSGDGGGGSYDEMMRHKQHALSDALLVGLPFIFGGSSIIAVTIVVSQRRNAQHDEQLNRPA